MPPPEFPSDPIPARHVPAGFVPPNQLCTTPQALRDPASAFSVAREACKVSPPTRFRRSPMTDPDSCFTSRSASAEIAVACPAYQPLKLRQRRLAR